jgi:hypothetical protein
MLSTALRIKTVKLNFLSPVISMSPKILMRAKLVSFISIKTNPWHEDIGYSDQPELIERLPEDWLEPTESGWRVKPN